MWWTGDVFAVPARGGGFAVRLDLPLGVVPSGATTRHRRRAHGCQNLSEKCNTGALGSGSGSARDSFSI